MKKLPSIRNLQYLIKLHETQNFNRAAKACFVSQSTLSSGIQNLEEQVGQQLIERDHKSFIFTALGEEVVEHAKQIVQSMSELTNLAESANQPMAGQLKLGCIPTIAPFVVKRLLNATNQKYPELELQFKEDTTENLLKLLDSGELDILLLAMPVDIGSLHSKEIGEDEFWLVAHKDYLAGYKNEPKLDELPDQSIYLLQREHCMTDHAVSACKLANSRKINPFSASSLHTLIEMVDSQMGTTFVPQMAIDAGLLHKTELSAIKPAEEGACRKLSLVWRPTTRRAITFNKLAELYSNLFVSNE